MTGTKNCFSCLFHGSAKPDSTASTSSPQKLPDYAERIREAAEAVDEEWVGADLHALFDYISRLSDFIKEEEKDKKEKKKKRNNLSKTKPAKDSLLVSKNFLILKDALSEAIEAAKDFASKDGQTIARDFLKGMGTARVVNIGFLVVANAWERYEQMSANQNECLSLLKEMSKLEQQVKELQKRPELKRGMEASIGEAIELIIEASIACCTQIEASKTRRYWSATSSREKLAKLEKKLQETYRDMQHQMGVCISDAVNQMGVSILDAVRQPKPHYPKYPKDTVGIEEPLQEVIKKLEWESDKKAVAVILHGFGGVGKTTLADAVFARLFEEKKEGCKFSFVKLFQNIKSTPNVLELQEDILCDLKGEEEEEEEEKKKMMKKIRRYNNFILCDLNGEEEEEEEKKKKKKIRRYNNSILCDLKGKEEEEEKKKKKKKKKIRRYNEGQEEIAVMLEKEEAFIYIDNVLLLPDEREQGPDALTQLLPEDMGNAKKVRLLITARHKDAADWMRMSKGVEKVFYAIESLPKAKAVELLEKELSVNKNQLNARQINGIVNICGGVPQLLKVLAGFINGGEGNAVENYKTLMNEAKEKTWKGELGEGIKKYVFAYDNLEDELKDPFLDICSFFRGWDWKQLSDIVGEIALKGLEKRALVTRDVKSRTARVHDVILEVGLQRTQGNRFRLTTATELEKFSHIEDEDLPKIKGIWATHNEYPLHILASKLDLMSGSLRVLKLGTSTDVEGKCENKFKELRFFSAITSHLPFDVSKLKGFEKLRHLCYNPEDLQNLCQMPSSLRHIKFELNSPRFQISSQCIQQLSNLRVLRLVKAQFKSLPEELGDLRNGLEELSLESCQYLEKLPASLSSLGSLTVLRMSGCSVLTQLPEHLGSLNCLQELSLQGCKRLEVLPSELENLTALQKLDLQECASLKALPRSLGKLTSLQQLDLSFCTSLEALPSSLEELSSLRFLDLSYCNIKDLPSGLEKLTSLVELGLLSCYELSSIPGSIGQLKLNSIDFSYSNLKELPDGFCNFSTLTELDMSECYSLKKLPERFGEVTSLRKLKLNGCRRLQKLPESFCQLKYLEHLDLSGCSTLEELCKDFEGLSLLRVLSLQGCGELKKLPEDFQCLTSLEVLDVRGCSMLEGKWIDSMLKMKTLQILAIAGSELLEERWEGIQAQQCNQSWSCGVYTKQGLLNEANLLKQFQSEFDSMLTNGEGKPLNISGRPLNTLLLVMFDAEEEFYPGSFPLPLLEESIDDIQTHFEMVYFGNHWDQLPKKVADRIVGHAPANRDTKALFRRLISLVVNFNFQTDFELTSSFQMTAEIVNGENDDKYLSRWEYFENQREKMKVEDFVVRKCGRYLKLKRLARRGGGSPIALLRELFAGGEEEISVSFLKNKDGESTKVGVDELQGKMILLDIRPGNNSFDSSLHALVEMYNVEKERFNFEIITVPIMQEDTTLDVSEKFSREVPWLVLQNPWQLTNTTKYFLIEGCPRLSIQDEWWYPKIMRIIESNGTFAPYNDHSVPRMLNIWGAAAFPFTAEKEEELIQKEKTQMEEEAIPHAIFLFQHLERVSEQLREATGQQKMIWLWCCDEKEFPNSMKDVLTELINIIYIIYIPYFCDKDTLRYEHFTYTNFHVEFPSKMSSAEMERMFSLSLSEYEAIRFWARISSLQEGINATDQFQLKEMLSIMPSDRYEDNPSWMFIMNEDGNLITTEGKEIVKLLSEKYSDDRVKELMQQLLKGTRRSWEKTLLELEEMLSIDGEDNEGYGDDDDVDSESIDGEDTEGYGDDDDVDSEGQ